MTPEERFERIERKHEQLAELVEQIGQKVDRIAAGHIELEGAQLNMTRVHTRLEEALTAFSTDTKERIDNLTVLVDRLIARDLQR